MPAKKKAARRAVTPARKAKSRLEKTWKETQAALSSAEGKVEKRVKELVKRSGVDTRQATKTIKAWGGRLDRERKKAVKQVEGAISRASRLRARKERRALARMVDETVQSTLAALNIPSRHEIQELTHRVEELSRKIDGFRRNHPSNPAAGLDLRRFTPDAQREGRDPFTRGSPYSSPSVHSTRKAASADPPHASGQRQRAEGKVALVCAGGGVTGAVYEIGCLRALDEVLDRSMVDLDLYVGVLGRAFVASLTAAGVTPREMYAEIVRRPAALRPRPRPIYHFDPRDLFRRTARAPRCWARRS